MAQYKVNLMLGDGTLHEEIVTADHYEKSIDNEINFFRGDNRVKVATFRQYCFILFSDPNDAATAPPLTKEGTSEVTPK